MTAARRTARLDLSVPGASDAPDVARLLGDPDVGAQLWPGALGGPRTAAQSRLLVRADAEHWDRHGFGPWVVRDYAGAFLGRAGLMVADVLGRPEVEVLWALLPAARGRGFATESAGAALEVAFGDLQRDSVVAFTLPGNRASRAVMERLGMTLETTYEYAGLEHVLYRVAR